MLTRAQNERLRDALGVLVEIAPDTSELTVGVPSVELSASVPTRRRFSPVLAGAVGFVVLLAAFSPLVFFRDGSGQQPPGSDTPAVTTTPIVPVVTGDEPITIADVPAGVVLGEPVSVSSPGQVWRLQASGEVLYASLGGPTDQIVQSSDAGASWDVVLEADPGDSEGLFAAGRLVVQVIEDDDPARGTVAPGSVVTDGLRVLVFDPQTGDQWETTLPRPEDPGMEPLSLDEPTDGCALGGYQSWVRASSVAVGDRLVVAGVLTLVGRLADGTVMCDGAVHSSLVWTSDDDGHTWDMHRTSQRFPSIAWTGERFVAWSTGIADNDARIELMVSNDGVEWASATTIPDTPDGLISGDAYITTTPDAVIAGTSILGWAAEIPDDVTDPEQLRDVLSLSAEIDIEDLLADMGVDLPLDEQEKATLAARAGHAKPVAAVIATSSDGGTTWATTLVDEPITAVVGISDGYAALTSFFGNPQGSNDAHSQLLTSTDGINWTVATDLPELSYGPRQLTATSTAIYFVGEQTGFYLKIPTS